MSTRQIEIWAGPRRILLATDLTNLSFTLPVAIQQAQTYKTELLIAYILPNPNAPLIDPVLMVDCEADRRHDHSWSFGALGVRFAFYSGNGLSLLCGSPCPVLVLKQDSTWANPTREMAQVQGTHLM